MKRILFTLTAVLLFSNFALAQPGRFFLRGIVMKDRKATEGAIIRVYKGNTKVDSTFSKKDGKYFLSLPLGNKFLIQFYAKGFSPKNISVETTVAEGMEVLDFNKNMVIQLSELKPDDLKNDIHPVAQFKFNANGELYEAGLKYQDVPKIIPTKDIQSILPIDIDASFESKKQLDIARKKSDSLIRLARYELDSARQQAYVIVNNAEKAARQMSKTPTKTEKVKPVYIYDTVFVERKTKEIILKEKTEELQKVNELEKAKEEELLRQKQLQIELLEAKARKDSLRIMAIDDMITASIEEINRMQAEIEIAEEKIRTKTVQLEKQQQFNIFVSSIAILFLLFFAITFFSYRKIRRLADELNETNKELKELSIVISETDNAVVIFDLEGKLEWVNKGFTKMYGYSLQDLESEKLDNIFLRKDKEISALHFEAVLEQGTQVSFESSTPHKEGYSVWAQTTMTPIFDEKNELYKVAAIDSNISQIKLAEAEIKLQKEKLELHNRMTHDSIRYAHTIQSAFLPTQEDLNSKFKTFLIDMPKDIVSGDFVWYSEQVIDGKEKVFIAAVDCTGHGVPGAFMSMIGSRLLTEIVTTMNIHDPAKILDKLNLEVQNALKQGETENTDGMDVCLCLLEPDADGCDVTFSGAQRPLLHYDAQNQKIIKIKGDIKTAGGFLSSFIDKQFTSHKIRANRNDMLYLTSDGIFDQNGPDRRRFGSKKVNKLINTFAMQPLNKQKEEFLSDLTAHQGNAEQRDDITVLGVRI